MNISYFLGNKRAKGGRNCLEQIVQENSTVPCYFFFFDIKNHNHIMNAFFDNSNGGRNMKSLYAIGTIALMLSSTLSAQETEPEDYSSLSYESLTVPELLSYIEGTVWLLVDGDEETCEFAHYELKESLKVIYTICCLCPEDAADILQMLDECYANLADAIDTNLDNEAILRESLMLFPSGRNYEHESFIAQPFQDLTETMASSELKSAIEAADADLIYIHESVLQEAEQTMPVLVPRNSSRLFYNKHPSRNSAPTILLIGHKSKGSSEYEAKGKISMKLGGKKHGKFSASFEGKIKDKNGGYIKGKFSKEKKDDGYKVDLEAGKKKEKK
jgi:hypothetical protein